MVGSDESALVVEAKRSEKVPPIAEFGDVLAQSGDRFSIVVTTSLDRRKRLVKELLGAATVVTCNGFKDWEMDKCLIWLNQRATALNIQLAPKAASLLVDMYGIQVEKLAQALQLAELYTLHHDQPISVSDIQAMFPEADASIFSLSESIKKGQFSGMFDKVQRLLAQKIDPIYLMAIMMSPVRLAAQLVLSPHSSPDQLAKSLGRNPYFIKRLLQDIKRHMTPDKISRIYRSAVDIDCRVKSGRISSKVGVQLLCEAFG